MKIRIMITLLILSALTTIAASGSDETKFIPKNYSGKKFKDNDYKPKSYNAENKHKDNDYKPSPKKRSFWDIFKINKTQKHKVQQDEELVDSKVYTQREQKPLPINRPEVEMLGDDSFENNTDKLDNKDFTPAEKPRGKDPMLRPRQGIKAPSK